MIVPVAVLGLGLSGCGITDNVAEKTAEEAAEKAIEAGSSGGGDVEVDTDDGTMTFENDEGSMSVGDSDLPDDFPDDMPLPQAEYTVGMSMATGDQIQASLRTTDDIDEFAEYAEQGLAESGYTIDDTQQSSMAGIETRTVIATGHGTDVFVSASTMRDEDRLMVNYRISPEEPE